MTPSSNDCPQDNSTRSPRRESGAVNRAVPESDLDLRDVLLILWRRKAIIFATLVAGMASIYLYLQQAVPIYAAQALLLIEKTDSHTAKELNPLLMEPSVGPAVVLSEVEILKSRTLIHKVILDLGLFSDPELNPGIEKRMHPGPVKQARQELDSRFKALNIYKDEINRIPASLVRHDLEKVATSFARNLSVRPVPGSHVIQVEYKSPDPAKAARIANEIPLAYIESRLKKKDRSGTKITHWLDDRLTSLRQQVRDSAAAVESYRAQNNLIKGARSDMTAQQLSELNSQLVLARTRRAEAEARLVQMQGLLENPHNIESISEVLSSPVIQNLKKDETDLRRQLSDLSAR